jgi:hypothetical protein
MIAVKLNDLLGVSKFRQTYIQIIILSAYLNTLIHTWVMWQCLQ